MIVSLHSDILTNALASDSEMTLRLRLLAQNETNSHFPTDSSAEIDETGAHLFSESDMMIPGDTIQISTPETS